MSSAKPRAGQERVLLRKANLVRLAHEEINRRIMEGTLQAGEKINLAGLAQEFGVSAIPIREALARLSAERLVIYEPNKGFRVAPSPDAREIGNLFEARLVIELGALTVGIGNLDEATLAELGRLNEEIRRHRYGTDFAAFAGFIALNMRFHEILVGLPDNPLVLEAYQRLGYHQRIPLLLHGHGILDIDRIVSEHDAIIDALARRSLPEARAALHAHIVDAYERLPGRVPAADHPSRFRSLNASTPAR